MEWELITHNSTSMTQQENINTSLVREMEDIWMNDKYIVTVLKHIMDNAITETKKWDIIEDFNAKLSAINTRYKLQKNSPQINVQIANVFQTWQNIL